MKLDMLRALTKVSSILFHLTEHNTYGVPPAIEPHFKCHVATGKGGEHYRQQLFAMAKPISESHYLSGL